MAKSVATCAMAFKRASHQPDVHLLPAQRIERNQQDWNTMKLLTTDIIVTAGGFTGWFHAIIGD